MKILELTRQSIIIYKENMGRLTELFDYLNREEHPTAFQAKHLYSYINIPDETLKKIRRDFRNKGFNLSCVTLDNAYRRTTNRIKGLYIEKSMGNGS